MYLHFCLVLIEGKDISCDTLEEKERALDEDIPQHGRDQDTAEIPEYLLGGGGEGGGEKGSKVEPLQRGGRERRREKESKIKMVNLNTRRICSYSPSDNVIILVHPQ